MGGTSPKIPLVKTTLIVNWPKEMAQDNVPLAHPFTGRQ